MYQSNEYFTTPKGRLNVMLSFAEPTNISKYSLAVVNKLF
jgi:hypothetical protein